LVDFCRCAKYKINSKRQTIIFLEVEFAPIEHLSWKCLTIGALGWGQIQIANSNSITLDRKNSRRKWMLDLCKTMLNFYPKEIGKIHKRIDRFSELKKQWENKTGKDIWK